jgi:hypothetical protein
MSASFQVCPGDLLTATRRISLLPIGMQTPVASTETRVYMVVGDVFSDCNGS